jgi:hypothetical protein
MSFRGLHRTGRRTRPEDRWSRHDVGQGAHLPHPVLMFLAPVPLRGNRSGGARSGRMPPPRVRLARLPDPRPPAGAGGSSPWGSEPGVPAGGKRGGLPARRCGFLGGSKFPFCGRLASRDGPRGLVIQRRKCGAARSPTSALPASGGEPLGGPCVCARAMQPIKDFRTKELGRSHRGAWRPGSRRGDPWGGRRGAFSARSARRAEVADPPPLENTSERKERGYG